MAIGSGWPCPMCEAPTRVLETRFVDELPNIGEAIRRRRECGPCQHRFTTYEVRHVDLVNESPEASVQAQKIAAMRGAVESLIQAVLQLKDLVPDADP